MKKKDKNGRRKLDLVDCLLENPAQGMSKIAETTGMHRRTVWQIQKDLEKDHTIWGYTTVINEQKLNQVVYLLQFKTKPFTKAFADLITQRLMSSEPAKQGVRILDVYYMNGDYDVFIKFSAPDHETARAYFEILRSVYKDHFLDIPRVSYVNLPLVQAGKLNPELKQKIYTLVPK